MIKFSQIEDDFLAYIYDNYSVGNGDQLLRFYEDHAVMQHFLDKQGLEYTEVDFD